MERIVLSRQAIVGSIPESWAAFTSLHTLIIGNNKLTGTFPDYLFSQNTLLGTIYVSNNELTGSLPPFSSAALESLRFEENMITGAIPAEVGGLTSLRK